jgi:hypothetical protein
MDCIKLTHLVFAGNDLRRPCQIDYSLSISTAIYTFAGLRYQRSRIENKFITNKPLSFITKARMRLYEPAKAMPIL